MITRVVDLRQTSVLYLMTLFGFLSAPELQQSWLFTFLATDILRTAPAGGTISSELTSDSTYSSYRNNTPRHK